MEIQKYYVYTITNIILNKKYVGCRATKNNINNDNYWGSSKYLKKDYIKYSKKNFLKEIIKIYKSGNAMLNGEVDNILSYNTMEPNGYNRMLPPKNRQWRNYSRKMSNETKLKISKKLTGRIISKESKRRQKETYAKKTKEEKLLIGLRISEAKKGHIHSKETKKKIGESVRRTKQSQKLQKVTSRAIF